MQDFAKEYGYNFEISKRKRRKKKPKVPEFGKKKPKKKPVLK